MRTKIKFCEMEGCHNTADGALGYCKACYAFMYYWHKKPLKAILRRIKAVKRADTRMSVLRQSRLGNVVQIGTRKRG